MTRRIKWRKLAVAWRIRNGGQRDTPMGAVGPDVRGSLDCVGRAVGTAAARVMTAVCGVGDERAFGKDWRTW